MRWHYNVLQEFNKRYYSGIVSYPMLTEETVIKGKFYWLVNYRRQKWLLDREIISDLPIKIQGEELLPYRNKLYHVVTEYSSVKIKPEKRMTFRELVDAFDLKHSSPKDFKLFKILALASEIGRLNFRVATEAGFGKDSFFSILGFLRNDVSIVNPRTAPAVEYRLLNKVLVLNELSNLESSQRALLQEILLLIGDLKNVYEKSSRATNDTKDEYDISKLSLVICYNTIDYYQAIGKEDKFFDNLFTHAVLDRFIPFKLNGRLDMRQFDVSLTDSRIEDTFKSNSELYTSVVRTIEWYKHNYMEELEKKQWNLEIKKTVLHGRHILLFEKICDFLALYAESKEEYQQLVTQLYKAYKEYHLMTNRNNMWLGEYQKIDENSINEELFEMEEVVEGD
ncbi:MAG: hypothetical protein J7L96_10290 [Bacteroidales bacterium]|nr:hypothetical protein [Bacteroidales bacterium]